MPRALFLSGCLVILVIEASCAPVGKQLPDDGGHFPGSEEPEAPSWEHVGDVAGCRIERVSNPEKHRAFAWNGYETDGVTTANLDASSFLADSQSIGEHSGLFFDGKQIKLTLQGRLFPKDGGPFEDLGWIVAEDGSLLEAYRATPISYPPYSCGVQQIVTNNTYTVMVINTRPDADFEAAPTAYAIVSITKKDGAARMFSVDLEALQIPAPDEVILGENRLVWSSVTGITSFSLGTPDLDARALRRGDENSEIRDVGVPSMRGDRLYFDEGDVHCGVSVCWQHRVMTSDGENEPTELISAEGEVDMTQPLVAGGFLSWQRLYGYRPGQTDEPYAELWASKLATTPEQLQPFKVMKLNYASFRRDLVVAGADHVAAVQSMGLPPRLTIANLNTSTQVSRTLDSTRYISRMLGMSNEYLYVLSRQEIGQTIYRVPID